MNESTRAAIILILIFILLLAIAYFGSAFLIKRATKTVIRTFRDNEALTAAKALTAAELGLLPKGFFQFRGLRDYKPAALQYLIRGNIVLTTEDGRLYLSEETLFQSGIEQRL